jgi:hypothetical protein
MFFVTDRNNPYDWHGLSDHIKFSVPSDPGVPKMQWIVTNGLAVLFFSIFFPLTQFIATLRP